MAEIDLSHNSAPLRGGMRPSLEQVNALLRQDPLVLWDCPQATSAMMADKRFLFVKLLCLIYFFGMTVAGLFLFSRGPAGAAQRPAGVVQPQAGPAPAATCRCRRPNIVCTWCYANPALNLLPISPNWLPRESRSEW